MLPKSTPSFPSPSPAPEDAPASYVEKGVPYADLAEFDTVVIISQPAGQSCAVVGGIMAARMRYLGVQGVVVDGRVRDLETLRNVAELMPIWAKGTSIIGAGAETKFHATDVTVRIGEVVVQPGDVVMIDPPENGVVVIPRNKLEEVLEMVPKLVEADEKVMQDVERGGSVKEAFAKFR
jgi:regulator of RNase E activity RraA